MMQELPVFVAATITLLFLILFTLSVVPFLALNSLQLVPSSHIIRL